MTYAVDPVIVIPLNAALTHKLIHMLSFTRAALNCFHFTNHLKIKIPAQRPACVLWRLRRQVRRPAWVRPLNKSTADQLTDSYQRDCDRSMSTYWKQLTTLQDTTSTSRCKLMTKICKLYEDKVWCGCFSWHFLWLLVPLFGLVTKKLVWNTYIYQLLFIFLLQQNVVFGSFLGFSMIHFE